MSDRRGGRGSPNKRGRGGSRPRRAGHGRERPPRAETGSRTHDAVHLSDDIVRELKATARPGKGDILVKVFSDAAASFAAGDLSQAIELAEQAKHIALRAAVVRELLGLAYYRAERFREAARELAAFRRLSGTTEQNPVIADCYRATGKPEKALEFCDEIRRKQVSQAVYYEGQIVAAGALADMGDTDGAIMRLEKLDLEPETAEEHHLRAWYALGDLLERRGRFTQAREWFDAVAAADPDLTDAPDRGRRLR